jgi:hypothetical protein
MVGTGLGHEIVGCVNVPAAMVGTGVGHATVPVGVTVCVWVARAEPVNASAGTVILGAVALQAVVDPVPAAMFVAAQFPLVAVAPFVPAGVPPLTALVVSEAPEKTGTLDPPVGHEIAPSAKAPPAFVGTPTGQAIAPSVNEPPEFDPAGVPALTALVASLPPVKVWAAAVRLCDACVPTSPAADVVTSTL